MKFVTCTLSAHGEAILDILNEQIRTSTAVYEYAPRTLDAMGPWFKSKEAQGFPIIGAQDETGALTGFAAPCMSSLGSCTRAPFARPVSSSVAGSISLFIS